MSYTRRTMLGKDYERQDCSLARALEVIGERWTLLIVRDAFYGVRRFSDFQAHLDVPKAVLSDRLAGLVEEGILQRQPHPQRAGLQAHAGPAGGRHGPRPPARQAAGRPGRAGAPHATPTARPDRPTNRARERALSPDIAGTRRNARWPRSDTSSATSTSRSPSTVSASS